MPPKRKDGNGRASSGPRSAAACGGRGAGGPWLGPDPGELLKGPRKPLWGCGGCGEAANWACRLRCRCCQRHAPRSVQNAARQADADWHARKAGTAEPAAPVQHARAAKARGGAMAPPGKEAGRARHRQPAKGQTFVEVVRQWGFDTPTRGEPQRPDEEADEDEDQGTEQRYWRDRRAAAVRAGPIAQADITICDDNLARLAAAAKAARPWASRVQAATAAHTKASSHLQSVEADLAAALLAVEALQAAKAAAEAEVQAAAQQLQQVKEEAAPDFPMPGGQTVEELLDARVRAAAAAGVDVSALTGRVADADVRRRQALGAVLPPPAASQPPLGHSQPTFPAAQPDPPTATGRQQGRRSRSRGAGKADDALSEAGSAAVGGRPRHR